MPFSIHPSSSSPLFNLPYEPLDEDKKEIRVLRFLNTHSRNLTEKKIECCIEHVSLKDPPAFPSHSEWPDDQENLIFWDPFTECIDFRDSYLEQTKISEAASIARAHNILPPSFRYVWGDFEALSYTWGNQNDTEEITVNKIDIHVPRNLGEALKALRDLDETRLGMYYWVDSLCINQNDKKEKEIQIKRMRDIYRQARAVVVWLGQAEAQDELAIETMRYLCHSPNVNEPLGLPGDLLADGGPALLAFMRKTYWTRSWIIQELAMNHNSTLILCGRSMLTRRMVRLGAIYCQELLRVSEELSDQPDHDLGFDGWSSARRLHHLMSLTFKPRARESLEHLLSLVRRSSAKFEVDKVYGIMGLLDPAIAGDIKPDYSSPVSEQQVYTDFIKSVIKRSNRLQQIMLGGISTVEGWPSWVPDLRKPLKRHHIKHLARRAASRERLAEFRFLKKGNNDCLIACGYQADEVDGIAVEPSSHYQSSQSSTTSNRYGDQMPRALQQSLIMNHPSITQQPLLGIPWTLERNTDTDTASSPPKSKGYVKRFDAFRSYNENFHIGGRSFRSFFPRPEEVSENTASTFRRKRLAMLSLEERALITTKTGYLGLAPKNVYQGDIVAILLGTACPVVLRPCGDNLYRVVGECYIHGLMDGEILDQESEKKVVQQEFVLC